MLKSIIITKSVFNEFNPPIQNTHTHMHHTHAHTNWQTIIFVLKEHFNLNFTQFFLLRITCTMVSHRERLRVEIQVFLIWLQWLFFWWLVLLKIIRKDSTSTCVVDLLKYKQTDFKKKRRIFSVRRMKTNPIFTKLFNIINYSRHLNGICFWVYIFAAFQLTWVPDDFSVRVRHNYFFKWP